MDILQKNNNNISYNNNIRKNRTSSSVINIKSKKNSQSNFVSLVNNLSSDIKLFYHSTKLFLNQGKEPNNKRNISSKQIFDLIEQNLIDFISKAKEIFKRMKYIQKINIIQQDMTHSGTNPQSLIQMNSNNDNIYLNSNYENNINRSYIMNKKKSFDDEVYIPSFCENSNNNTNNNNNVFYKNNSDNEINNDNNMIKSLNNSSKDMKIINKYNRLIDIEENQNRYSVNKIMYNNYNQYNNLKRNNNNNKSVINLRKKIIFDKKQDNSSIGSLGVSSSKGINNNTNLNNSNNLIKNKVFIGSKEIFDKLYNLISLIKELKLIKGNIFIKSLEAEKHKNLLNKIYNEIIKIIQIISKNNKKNSLNNSVEDGKQKNHSSNNLTFNNRLFNKNENNIENIRTDNYNKDINFRDLIIHQSKQIKNINNDNKNLYLIKQQCIELQKEKEKMIKINNELKQKIIYLEKIKNKLQFQPKLLTQNFSFQYIKNENYIGEKAQKILDELNEEIKEKNENIEKINIELNTYKEKDNKSNEEISKLIEEINKKKEEINKCQKEIENLSNQNKEYINDNKQLKENLEIENNNIEKYKKIVSYQEEEIKNLKNNTKLNNKNNNSNIKEESEKSNKNLLLNNNNNNINIDEKKNKKRNNSKNNEYQIEQDKIYLKYELLKNDYDKLNNTLQQKQKLLDNYSKISSETASKTNIDEQILELMAEHKKEIESLKKEYNKNIINLKMNQPSPFSPQTHKILIDKRYASYDLKWYLLTIITEEEKNYENTFWVSDIDMKPIINQFDKFKTEREIEDEKFENLYKMQEKWIKQIDENEKLIQILKDKLAVYDNKSLTE